MVYQYEYPRPSVSADVVVLKTEANVRSVLLIERGHDPFAGCWALPGGFMDMDETIEDAAIRELQEETSLVANSVTQVATFSAVDRDPRGRVLSVAFLTEDFSGSVAAGDDAARAAWYRVTELPPLAFDHAAIIAAALAHPLNGVKD